MAKWFSVLFSDVRNKLGDQVVFSNWKGRGYMRTWVKPANPRTLKQRAVRDHMKKLVQRWQEISGDADVVSAYNNRALDYQISGYNLFVKFGRKSEIECPATGSVGSAITITYKCEILTGEAGIYVVKPDGTIEDITPAEGLSTSGTVEYTPAEAGDYYFFIAIKTVLKTGDTAPQEYQMVNKWKPDYTTGQAVEAKCTVS